MSFFGGLHNSIQIKLIKFSLWCSSKWLKSTSNLLKVVLLLMLAVVVVYFRESLPNLEPILESLHWIFLRICFASVTISLKKMTHFRPRILLLLCLILNWMQLKNYKFSVFFPFVWGDMDAPEHCFISLFAVISPL